MNAVNNIQEKRMDQKVAYWLALSEYDLETSKAMLTSKRYLYVGFMCHQSIEKLLKAYWQQVFSAIPPRIHNLALLAQKTGLLKEMPDILTDVMDELEPLNIQTRYPEYRDWINKRFDGEYANQLIQNTEGLHKWIVNRLLQPRSNI